MRSIVLSGVVVSALASAGEATAWCVRERDAAGDVGVVRVCAPDGAYDAGARVLAEPGDAPVGARLLWVAPGEGATVVFDCSAKAERYRVEPAADAGAWQPRAGVIGESRTRIDAAVDTWEQVEELWNKAPSVRGRGVLPFIYWGVDPFAEAGGDGFLADFRGWFAVPQAGAYQFATVSDDASFVAVDDQVVIRWGGWHGLDEGHRGEKNATVQLQPGLHQVRYRYVENADNPIIELAWKPPGADKLVPMPAEAFAPIARYRVERVGDGAWFDWSTADDCSAGGEYLVALTLRARVPAGCEARWRFDDGSEATGAEVRHAFARASQRRIRLAAAKDGKEVGAGERTALAQPRWSSVERWNDGAHQRLRDELIGRDPLAMPAADVLALVRYAKFVGEMGWLERIGVAVAKEPTRWGRDGIELLATIGFVLQDDEVRRLAEAADCWRGFLALPGEHDQRYAHVALHLAGVLIHGLDRGDEAAAVLNAIDPAKLDETERRLRLLYQGDAALAAGNLAAARARYAEAGDAVPHGDLHYSVRRRARLESARAWVARGEFESALQALAEIEWETPIDRMGPETGLLKVRAWLGRKQIGFALACCRRLLIATAADDRRADVLAAMAEVCLAAGRRDDAVVAVAKLKDEFPYSEAAARTADLMKGGR